MTSAKIDPIYSPARQFLLIILTIFIACLLYEFLEFYSLKHSAVLFLGIPVFMSIALAVASDIKHVTINIVLGLSFGLLVSFLYLNEGSFCVPITAPLFLITGLIVSSSFIKLKQSNYSQLIYFLPVLFLLILSLEGLTSHTTLSRNKLIQTVKVVQLSGDEVQQALTQNRSFSQLPFMLSIGFPQPTKVSNQGSEVGDIRSVYFSGGEGDPGTAEFQVTHRTPNSIEYRLVNDSSHISHWLKWKSSKVSWVELDPAKTRVSWSIEYERQLDPAWYFSTLQNFAVKLSAEALIENLIL